jgi:hypothetical protein
MLLRYIIIFLLVYLLYRLIRATLLDFTANLGIHRRAKEDDRSNVSGARKHDLDDIPEAKYEEIKEDKAKAKE